MRQLLLGAVCGASFTLLAAWAVLAGAQSATPGPATDLTPAAITRDPACNKPALLVVTMDDLDRSKTKAYGEALRRTQIVRRHGGRYLAYGEPNLRLEGDWPAGRAMVIERYPCLEAVRQFWQSDEYQKDIKPLRDGAGRFLVAAFEER